MTEDHFNPSFPGEGEADVSCGSTRNPARSSAESQSLLARGHTDTHGGHTEARIRSRQVLHKDVLFSSLCFVRKYLKNSYTDQEMAVEGIW